MLRAAMYLSKRTSIKRIASSLDMYLREHDMQVRQKPLSLKAIYEELHQEAQGQIPVSPLPVPGRPPGEALIIPVAGASGSHDDEKPEAEHLSHGKTSTARTPVHPPPEKKAAAEPHADSEEKESISPPQARDVKGKRLRALIGDPDHSTVFLLQSMLQDFVDCIAVSSGLEMIDKARRYLPDVIIVNMRLHHLPGFEVSRILHAHPGFRATPIFGITKAGDHLRSEYVGKYAVSEMFMVPAEIERLVYTIRAVADDPDFVQNIYPQTFAQVLMEEEKNRFSQEQVLAVSERLRREKTFQDLFRESRRRE
jgi:CheY-like chemotaxis protein